MMRQPALTWLWSAVLVLSVLSTWFVVSVEDEDNRRDPQAAAQAHGEFKPVALVPAMDSISALEIITEGQPHRLEKTTGGKWFQHTRNHAGSANSQHRHNQDLKASVPLNRNLAMFGRLTADRIVRKGRDIDLEAYGLLFPIMVVVVYAHKPSPVLILHFGDLAPDGIGRYAYVPQTQSLVIIPDYHHANLMKMILPTAPE